MDIVDKIIATIKEDERAFTASVKAGDRVQWREWVWERGITGNPADPDTSDLVLFTGTVQQVSGGALHIDPDSVHPSALEVRQRPRHCLPIGAFQPVK